METCTDAIIRDLLGKSLRTAKFADGQWSDSTGSTGWVDELAEKQAGATCHVLNRE
jgi:hypothetical protein